MNGKKLTIASVVYVGASVFAHAIKMFLIPLYTKNISIVQYGEYNIIISIQSLLAIFATLGVYSGFSRFFYEYEDKNRLKNITLTFSVLCGCFFAAGAYLLREPVARLVLSGVQGGGTYMVYVAVNAALIGCASVYRSHFSMKLQALKASAIEIFNLACTFAASFVFLTVFNAGIAGILKAQLIANLLVLVVLLAWDIRNIRLVLSMEELRQMLKFSVWLIPGNASEWILTLADRYFIKAFVSMRAVAVYSVGYKIGSLVQMIFIKPFESTFSAYKFKVYKEEGGKERILRVFQIFNFMSWLAILAVSVYADIAIRLLSTGDYSQAYRIVPLIAISYYLYGLGMFYCMGIQIANKTMVDSVILICAAGLNIIFNFAMIPRYGMYGAAITTIISYLFTNVMYYIFGRRYYDLSFSVFSPFKFALLFAGVYGAYLYFKAAGMGLFGEIVLNTLLCSAYAALCMALGLIEYSVIRGIIAKLSKRDDVA